MEDGQKTYQENIHDYGSRQKAIGEQDMIERQRRTTFIYACVAMMIADVVLWFLGMRVFGDPFYELLHPIHFILTISLLLLCMRAKLSFVSGVVILCTANQLSVLFEMGQCLMNDHPQQIALIMGYMVLSGFNMALVLMTYVRTVPFVLAALAMIGYGVCCWATREVVLVGMLPLFVGCFFVTALLGSRLNSNAGRLQQEKDVLQEDEQQILSLFGMSKDKLMAYVSMARTRGLPLNETAALLEIVGPGARETIRENVLRYFRQQEIDYSNLQARLPELSASEIAICDLILKEKKLKEIARLLDKTESNITCQRANIRKKLGLTSSENLRNRLLEVTKVWR
jgi:DNA-binding CsgD family transcriptional regulator